MNRFNKSYTVLFFLVVFFVQKQSAITPYTIDSLTTIIEKEESSLKTAEALTERARYLGGTEPAKAIHDYLAAIHICQKKQLNKQLIEYQKKFISYLYYTGRIQLCMHYYLLFSDYLQSNNLAEEAPQLYNIYGNLLSRQGNYKKALLYYYSALAYGVKNNDSILVGKCYLNIGVTRFKLSNYQSAAYYAEKAIPYYKQKSPKELSNVLELKAEAYFGMGYTDTARNIAQNILHTNNLNNYVISYANKIIANVFVQENKSDSALQRFNSALHYSKLFGSKELSSDICLSLSKLYENKKDFENAHRFHSLHKAYSDSVQLLKEKEELNNLQLNFEIARDQEKINEQNQTIETTKLKLYLSIFGIMLFVFLFGFSLYAFFQKKKANELIFAQKKEIEEKNQEINDSIRYAQKIQETLLANKELANQVIPDSFLIFEPRDIVSGDFYWAARKENFFYLAVCDSTGHGVPGSFMSLLNINYLNEAVSVYANPNEIFNEVRKRLSVAFSENERKDGMDGILIRINVDTKQIVYTAAQNKPILVSSKGAEHLNADKMHVGIGYKTDSFKLFELNYTKGDMLYLNTDGFCDQFGGPKQRKFMQKRLMDQLTSIYTKPCEEQKELLLNSFHSWKGKQDQVDDVCLIGIRL